MVEVGSRQGGGGVQRLWLVSSNIAHYGVQLRDVTKKLLGVEYAFVQRYVPLFASSITLREEQYLIIESARKIQLIFACTGNVSSSSHSISSPRRAKREMSHRWGAYLLNTETSCIFSCHAIDSHYRHRPLTISRTSSLLCTKFVGKVYFLGVGGYTLVPLRGGC